ncbi:MtN3/saliva family protein [compost metagenome]
MSTEMTGIIAGIFTGISLLPQLIKLIREQKTQDISVLMLTALLIGLSLWVVYGIQKKDWPIIVTNSFSLLVNCCLLVLNFYYRKRKH